MQPHGEQGRGLDNVTAAAAAAARWSQKRSCSKGGDLRRAQGRAWHPSKEAVCGWEAARAPAGPTLRGIRGTRVMALTGLESLTFIFKVLPRASRYSSLLGRLV